MSTPKGRVLFYGNSYYNTWYLSRALRRLGWKADTLRLDNDPGNDQYYHGQDLVLPYGGKLEKLRMRAFQLNLIPRYDIFHFSGIRSINPNARLLKRLGKKVVYSNNGCMDGVTPSTFRKWPPVPVCDDCRWRDDPSVCSDEGNRAWGELRNSIADYQINFGGNRADYNDDPRVHEVPEFYCLDPERWSPDLMVPANYLLAVPKQTVKIYHSVGNYQSRTALRDKRNIKSTHIYLEIIERLKAEGRDVELIFFTDVPNPKLPYYQVQADIVVDMLTFGWFGANGREAMMLGKPFVCYIRPEWLEQVRREVPEYADELPVVNATPESIHAVLADLIADPAKRAEIGRRSRQFALKWHSAEAGARRMDRIYSELLGLPAGSEALPR